jgi:ribose 5-phosphate isomerase A
VKWQGPGATGRGEKLVAAAPRQFVVIADDSTLVQQLGTGPLPVEALPFLWRQTAKRLEMQLGASSSLCGQPTAPYITDNGNVIVELVFPQPITDPDALDAQLKRTVGVVEHGLFLGMADMSIVVSDSGIKVLSSERAGGRRG